MPRASKINTLGVCLLLLAIVAMIVLAGWYFWTMLHVSGMEAIRIHYLGEMFSCLLALLIFLALILIAV